MCAEDDQEEPSSRWILERDACSGLAEQADGMEDAGRRLLEDALEGGQMTDVEFLLDSGDRIRGHKLWLMNRCKIFRRMMLSGMEESRTGVIPVRECSKGAFMVLFEYLYTGRLGATACLEQDWAELWMLQDLLGLEQMGNRLLDAVTLANVERAVRVGVERGIFELLKRCVQALPCEGASSEQALCIMRVVGEVFGVEKDREELLGGAVEAVVNAMRSNIGDEEVQETGCRALWQIARSKNQVLAGQRGGVEDAVSAMFAFPKNTELQVEACIALGSLCDLQNAGDNHLRVQRAGGILMIFEAMREHNRSDDLQYYGCFALSTITRDLDCADDAIHESTMHAIIWAMNRCLNSAEAVACGYQLMWNLLRVVSKRERCKAQILRNDGFEHIITGMRAHAHHAGLQELGCRVLAKLMSGKGKTTEECLTRAISVNGAFFVVSDAMEAHPEISGLHHEGCNVLAQVAGASVEDREFAVEKGGIETVVNAIVKFKSNALVQETGCTALAKFVANDAENCRRARKAGGIEAVVEGMKCQCERLSQVDRASVMLRRALRSGCFALAQLTLCNSKNRRIAGEAGAVEAVLNAMKSDLNDDQMQSFGCDALGNLALDQKGNRSEAVEMGAVDLVKSLMDRHSSRHDVLRCAWHALRFLTIT